MHPMYTEMLVHARLAELVAERDLSSGPVRARPAGGRRFGRRRRRPSARPIT
jgi:hypothetical protein